MIYTTRVSFPILILYIGTDPPTVSISASIDGSLNNGCETPGNMLCPMIGQRVTISCAFTGIGIPVNPGDSSYEISGPTPTSPSTNDMDLVINSFQASDAGTYQCTVINRCGTSTDSIPIIFTGMFVFGCLCTYVCLCVCMLY